MRSSNARGFTLIEMAIAISISGVLALASYAYVSRIFEEGKVEDIANEYAGAVSNIEKHFRPRSVANITLSMAAELGAFRRSELMRDLNGLVTDVHSAFGASVAIGAAPAGWGVHYSGIPARVCPAMLLSGAGTLASAILVVPEAQRGQSVIPGVLPAWLGLTVSADGAGLGALPPGYQLVKNLGRSSVSVDAMAMACNQANTDSYGIVFLRSSK